MLRRVDVETESSGKEPQRVARFDAKQNPAFTPVKKGHKRGSIKKTLKTKTKLYVVFLKYISTQLFDFKFHIVFPCHKICTFVSGIGISPSLPNSRGRRFPPPPQKRPTKKSVGVVTSPDDVRARQKWRTKLNRLVHCC